MTIARDILDLLNVSESNDPEIAYLIAKFFDDENYLNEKKKFGGTPKDKGTSNWVQKTRKAWKITPTKAKQYDGLHSKGAGDIAATLAKGVKNLQAARAKLDFYVNRAGSKIDAPTKKKYDAIVKALYKKFGK